MNATPVAAAAATGLSPSPPSPPLSPSFRVRQASVLPAVAAPSSKRRRRHPRVSRAASGERVPLAEGRRPGDTGAPDSSETIPRGLPPPDGAWCGVFIEVGGSGQLSRAVAARGVPTVTPLAVGTGCSDLAQPAVRDEILATISEARSRAANDYDVLSWVQASHASGLEGLPGRACLFLHVGGATLQRSRDRRPGTRLRSPTHPWGDASSAPVIADNAVARHIAAIISAAHEHSDVCIVVSPPDSYLWRLLGDVLPETLGSDTDLTLCMFGDSGRRPLRLRAFGDIHLTPLRQICRTTNGSLGCGRPAHTTPISSIRLPASFVARSSGLVARRALAPHRSVPSGSGSRRSRPKAHGPWRDRGRAPGQTQA